jgi:hypothetical protein
MSIIRVFSSRNSATNCVHPFHGVFSSQPSEQIVRQLGNQEVSGFQGFKISRKQVLEISWNLGFSFLKVSNILEGFLSFLGFKVLTKQGFEVSSNQGFKFLRYLGFEVSKFQDFEVSRTQGFSGSRNQYFRVSKFQESSFRSFKVLTFQDFEILGF